MTFNYVCLPCSGYQREDFCCHSVDDFHILRLISLEKLGRFTRYCCKLICCFWLLNLIFCLVYHQSFSWKEEIAVILTTRCKQKYELTRRRAWHANSTQLNTAAMSYVQSWMVSFCYCFRYYKSNHPIRAEISSQLNAFALRCTASHLRLVT